MRAKRIRILRFCRAVLALLAVTNLVFAWLCATAWHSPGWSVASGAMAVFACGVIAYSTKVLHLLGWRRVLGLADLLGVTWILLAGHDERARLREAVARRRRRPMMLPAAVMERDIFGQAFEHAGVPSLPTRPGPPGLPPATVAQRGGYGAAGYLDDLCLYVSRLANSPDPAVRKCARAWFISEAGEETRRLTAQYPQTRTGTAGPARPCWCGICKEI